MDVSTGDIGEYGSSSSDDDNRHYLLKELELLIQAGSAPIYGEIFTHEERGILESLTTLSASQPLSCLTFCKFLSKTKEWYKADTLFSQRQQVALSSFSTLHLT